MFIYTVFVFYNLYIYIVRLSLIIIYSPRFCCCYFTSFFTMKNYICPKKNSVIYLSFYHVSISHLQAVNCIPWAVKNLLVSVKSLSQMFMSHIRKCMFRLCVYLLGIYINHFMYIVFFCLFRAIITDQRGSLTGLSIANGAGMKWKRKKRANCISFLVLKIFSLWFQSFRFLFKTWKHDSTAFL